MDMNFISRQRAQRSLQLAIEPGAVPVLLWEISARDEASLDVYEGYPVHYRKEVISVE